MSIRLQLTLSRDSCTFSLLKLLSSALPSLTEICALKGQKNLSRGFISVIRSDYTFPRLVHIIFQKPFFLFYDSRPKSKNTNFIKSNECMEYNMDLKIRLQDGVQWIWFWQRQAALVSRYFLVHFYMYVKENLLCLGSTTHCEKITYTDFSAPKISCVQNMKFYNLYIVLSLA